MGHVYRLLLNWSPFWRTAVGGVCAFLLFSVPLGLLASKSIWGRLTSHSTITAFLNVASIVLVAIPVWMIVSTLYTSNIQVQMAKERQAQFEVPVGKQTQSVPDIYLIIVDGYGRADMLQNIYGYDNSQFMNFLKEKGFYVADRSTSNYPQTELSLSSMLNLQYMDEYVEGFGENSDRSALRELLQHTRVRQLLRDMGYTFIALPSATLFAQMKDADMYFSLSSGDLNEFEGLLLSSTVLGVAVESWGVDLPIQSYELHRRYVLFALEKLRQVPDIPGPKFVFAHIMSPHPPFIFDRDGGFIIPDRPYSTWDASLFPGTSAEYQRGYTDQMIFLNGKLTEVVTDILAKSANPPVIILQGDHGPGAFYNTLELDDSCLVERYSILNAYFFPDQNYELLYPTITPVNSFRVVLDQYFGADLDLLEDRNYFAGWLSPYLYTEVTDRIQPVCYALEENAK